MKRSLLIGMLSVGIATLANAQATRTWVSGVGDDVNPCSRTAPCKTFAGAISKTASPGIINCLDPGGFGAVTITKSITIDCTGTYGSVLASGTQGVVVNALTTDNIVLRAIDINGAGSTLGTNGVSISQAANVSLYNVNVGNFSAAGLKAINTSNAIGVFVSASEFTNCGNVGIWMLNSSSGTTKLTVTDSVVENGGNVGIDVGGPGDTATVVRTKITKNVGVGFLVENGTSVGVLEGSVIAMNGTGVQPGVSGQTPTIRMSRNSVINNTSNGLLNGSGTTLCFASNMIDGNGGGTNTCTSAGNTQQ